MQPENKKHSQNNTRHHLTLMCLSGLFSALVFVVTAYLHIPTYNGYVHFGDGFIFLSACILPMPYSLLVGAVGALLADLLTGYAIWAPGSVIIKTLIALLFTCKSEKILSVRNILMILPSAFITILGYYFYEAMITANFIVPLAGMIGSAIQSVASGAVFIALGIAMDKYKFKRKFMEIMRK